VRFKILPIGVSTGRCRWRLDPVPGGEVEALLGCHSTRLLPIGPGAANRRFALVLPLRLQPRNIPSTSKQQHQ
jgi:hypothetical protein